MEARSTLARMSSGRYDTRSSSPGVDSEGRPASGTADDSRALARACQVPFVYSPTLDSAERAAAFAQAGSVVFWVSVNFTGIVSQQVIDRFPCGILNAHGGELDSGDSVTRAYRPLALADRIGEVLEWIGAETPRLSIEAVARLASAGGRAVSRSFG